MPLLSAVLAACPAGPVVVVGPDSLANLAIGRAVLTREDPPGGGPVAGVAAGLAALAGEIDVVQLLPCDVPGAAEIISALDEQSWNTDALVPVDGDAVAQFLLGRYQRAALSATLPETPASASVHGTLRGLSRTELLLPAALLADLDEPADAERAGYARPRA